MRDRPGERRGPRSLTSSVCLSVSREVLLRVLVSIPYGDARGYACARPAKRRVSAHVSPARPAREPSIPTLRDPLRNRQIRLGRAFRATVRFLAGSLGSRRGRLPRLRIIRIGLRHRSVPGLQGRVSRRLFLSVSRTLSLLQRQARRYLLRAARTQWTCFASVDT